MTEYIGQAFPNAPYRSNNKSSYSDCASDCISDNTCLGVNFNDNSRTCDYFAAPSEYAAKPGTTAGVKTQPIDRQ